MNIQFDNNSYPANFKAYKAASIKPIIKNFPDKIDIYELNNSDNKFLEELQQKTNFKKLLPDLSLANQKRWQQIFDYCIAKSQEKGFKTVVAVCKEKLCGIMTTCLTDNKKCCIEGICAIPDEKGHKTPFIGQSFFLYLFNKNNSEKRLKGYTLNAVTDGPVDVVKKYKELGFREENTITGKLTGNDTDHIYLQMSCNQYTAKDKCNELKNKFSILHTTDTKQTDLFEFIG